MLGAIEADQILIVAAFMISSLLNVAYLLPVVSRAFFSPPPKNELSNGVGIKEAPLLCWVPTVFTAASCLILFFYSGYVHDFLTPITR